MRMIAHAAYQNKLFRQKERKLLGQKEHGTTSKAKRLRRTSAFLAKRSTRAKSTSAGTEDSNRTMFWLLILPAVLLAPILVVISLFICICCRKGKSTTDSKEQPLLKREITPPAGTDPDKDDADSDENETPRGYIGFIEAAKNKLGDRMTPSGEAALKKLAKDSGNMSTPSKALRNCIRKGVPQVTREVVEEVTREG